MSANKEVFYAAAPPYQEALSKSGHTHKLEYKPTQQCSTKKKNNVKTNIGRDFLKLIESQWDLVDQAPTFNPTTRKCRVCLKEKNQI